MSKTKLELTRPWKNKDYRLEPRILIHKPDLSYGDPKSENMLIHWDNLLALKALEQEYAGKIKCIYIDPPYNIEVANPHYEDWYEHSERLTLMYQRLLILRNLLSKQWAIFVQIDDWEWAYLKIIMDEVFWRDNFVNCITVKMSEASWVKMSHASKRLPKMKEYILLYKKEEQLNLDIDKVQIDWWNPEYKTFLENFTKDDKKIIDDILSKEVCNEEDSDLVDEIFNKISLISIFDKMKSLGIDEKKSLEWKLDNARRITQFVWSSSVKKYAEIKLWKKDYLMQEVWSVISPKGLLYFFKVNFDKESKQPRVQMIFADHNLFQHPWDLWLDVKTTWGVWWEWWVLFPNSKKPEKLIQKIIQSVTKPWDFVLDSFLWSWTTSAVAHKMWRKWIGIELWEHAYSHCKARVDKVIDWEQWWVSKFVEWNGGGGYKFYELWPSVLIQDNYGNYIINPEFKSADLIQSLCKIENFTYKAYLDNIKHGYSTEKDFIHVTTRHITQDILNDIINNSLKQWETMLVVAKTFASDLELPECIQIKKIPPEILGKCEYNKNDYSLPITESIIEDEEEIEE